MESNDLTKEVIEDRIRAIGDPNNFQPKPSYWVISPNQMKGLQAVKNHLNLKSEWEAYCILLMGSIEEVHNIYKENSK